MKHFFKRMVSMTIALAACLSVVAAASVVATMDSEENSPYLQIFSAGWEEDSGVRS